MERVAVGISNRLAEDQRQAATQNWYRNFRARRSRADQSRETRQERFRTNIAKMPDFIGIFGHFLHAIREPIVRVGENEDTQRAFRFVHIFKRKFECSRIKTKAPTLLKRYGCMQRADYRRGTQLNLADTADSADSKCFTDDSTRSLSRVGSSQPGNSPFGFARPALSELL